MDEMEEKLGAIFSNPQMMQQIMSMAQAMSSQQNQPTPPPQQNQSQALPLPDPKMIQNLTNLASTQGGIDQDQQALLNALGPFISSKRIRRLEKAMRAAKMAKFATVFLGQSGSPFPTGR